MYEHHTRPLLPHRAFLMRLAGSAALGFAMIAVSLAIGMLGYHRFYGLGFADSFLNAAMILGGMGPVADATTNSAKIFAGVYALYSGLALIGFASIVFAPIVHRFLHRFHLETSKDLKKEEQ